MNRQIDFTPKCNSDYLVTNNDNYLPIILEIGDVIDIVQYLACGFEIEPLSPSRTKQSVAPHIANLNE